MRAEKMVEWDVGGFSWGRDYMSGQVGWRLPAAYYRHLSMPIAGWTQREVIWEMCV